MLATLLTFAVLISPFHSHNKNHVVSRPHKAIHHVYKKHRPLSALPPMEAVAILHKWNSEQVADAWRILYLESNSTPGNVNLDAVNSGSGCVGAAQFLGWDQYYTYGGNPTTVRGQLLAFANYIKERYNNDPAYALQFHYANGWY